MLARDRPHYSISMGMGGGVLLPQPVSRETIRREGERQAYTGDDLEDFVEIVVRIDDYFVETEIKRAAADTKAAAAKLNKR